MENAEGDRSRASRLVVVGNFDGVHRGHQALLADAAKEAEERGLAARLLTFDPHPAVVLGQAERAPLTTTERKCELVRAAANIEPFVRAFSPEFAMLDPEAFAKRELVGAHGAKVVIVGLNFRFGRDRAGDFDELARLGSRLGFETRSHPLVGDASGPWSSTRIRAALAAGDVEEAARMLGRPHGLSGKVEKGDQRGRTIGFPTANVREIAEALPPNGVYAVRVASRSKEDDPNSEALVNGVANLGVRPTIASAEPARLLEVHLFDFSGDLYGRTLRVDLVARLRGEQKFAGLDALKAQIAKDVEEARRRLAR